MKYKYLYFTRTELIPCYRENKNDRCKGCRLQQAVRVMPDQALDENMDALVEFVLDPAREAYGAPVYVSSGFRCVRYNAGIGVRNSQHTRCQAADITTGGKEGNLKLAKIIVENEAWDQMILYVDDADSLAPRFIHVSYTRAAGGNRKQILKQVSGRNGYEKVSVSELFNK